MLTVVNRIAEKTIATMKLTGTTGSFLTSGKLLRYCSVIFMQMFIAGTISSEENAEGYGEIWNFSCPWLSFKTVDVV